MLDKLPGDDSPKCFLRSVVIFMFVSVNVVYASFRQFLSTIKYDLVALGKDPYLEPISASLYQIFLISANFPATARSLGKATSLV